MSLLLGKSDIKADGESGKEDPKNETKNKTHVASARGQA